MTEQKYILAGRFIDGCGGPYQRDVVLEVVNGRIVDIESGAKREQPNRAKTIDLSHCTLLPPLVDCSLRLSSSASTDRRVRQNALTAELAEVQELISQNIHFCHSHGVLAVADCDNDQGFVSQYRDEELDEGHLLLKTSAVLWGEEQMGQEMDTGPTHDFSKIFYTRDVAALNSTEEILTTFSRENLEHMLKIRQNEKRVVLANGSQAVSEALDGGCDGLEQGIYMGEDNLKRMAVLGTIWIPSVVKIKSLQEEASGEEQRYYKKILADQLAQLRVAKELGVTVAVGTAAGSSGIIHGESVVEELRLLQQAGYSLIEALRCASANGAGLLGIDSLGELGIGRPATFLVSRGMVQQLPRKLLYLEDIYIDGVPSTYYRKNPVKTVYKRR